MIGHPMAAILSDPVWRFPRRPLPDVATVRPTVSICAYYEIRQQGSDACRVPIRAAGAGLSFANVLPHGRALDHDPDGWQSQADRNLALRPDLSIGVRSP